MNITFDGESVQHNPAPKYLGITLDRSLTYGPHIEKLTQKIKTRNNVITCGITYAGAETLRIAALSLVYSATEYYTPVWTQSKHAKKIDTQLNITMHIISGTLKPTPTPWLPILSNIPPPPLRHEEFLKNEWNKYKNNEQFPINSVLLNPPRTRLKSRTPFWLAIEESQSEKWHSS